MLTCKARLIEVIEVIEQGTVSADEEFWYYDMQDATSKDTTKDLLARPRPGPRTEILSLRTTKDNIPGFRCRPFYADNSNSGRHLDRLTSNFPIKSQQMLLFAEVEADIC